MELRHLLQLVSELPKNTKLNYVRGTDECKFIDVDIDGERVNSETPLGEPKSWAPTYLEELASKIFENEPFNLSGLLNNKGSYRPVLETIIAHTREFYTVRKGTATALVWIPSMPKTSLELTEIESSDIPAPKPRTDSNKLLPPDELKAKVRDSFIKFWNIIDQHGADKDSFVSNFENALNPFIEQLDLGYTSVFQIIDFDQYEAIISEVVAKHPEIAYVVNGRSNHGIRYEVGSTHMHYRNFLKIIALSDFRANLDTQKENTDSVLSKTTANDSSQYLRAMHSEPLQVIYFGAPGTGKSHKINKASAKYPTFRTTFHPDTDYASFVGSYKPITIKVPIYGIQGQPIRDAQNNIIEEDRIVYHYVFQSFLQAYIKAWEEQTKEEPQPVFLVIEEINRGNCAQIFGDIFQLLDRNATGFSDYPIVADKDLAQELNAVLKDLDIYNADKINAMYDGGHDVVAMVKRGEMLLLPNNLYIWATMNTSDQSLFPIDSAFKRRWDWEYIKIKDHSDQRYCIRFSNGNRYDWWEFVSAINNEIEGGEIQQEDKKLGYFFAKTADGIITAKRFLSKVIFYLYTDVFKDFGFDEPFFKDENGVTMTFASYFNEEGDPDESRVERFLTNLGLEPIMNDNDENGQNDASENRGSDRKYSNFRVIFTDDNDHTIEGVNQTQTFISCVQYLGFEQVLNLGIYANKRWSVPLISKNPEPDELQRWNDQKEIKAPKLLPGTEYYISTDRNIVAQSKLIQKIAELLNREIRIEPIYETTD